MPHTTSQLEKRRRRRVAPYHPAGAAVPGIPKPDPIWERMQLTAIHPQSGLASLLLTWTLVTNIFSKVPGQAFLYGCYPHPPRFASSTFRCRLHISDIRDCQLLIEGVPLYAEYSASMTVPGQYRTTIRFQPAPTLFLTGMGTDVMGCTRKVSGVEWLHATELKRGSREVISKPTQSRRAVRYYIEFKDGSTMVRTCKEAPSSTIFSLKPGPSPVNAVWVQFARIGSTWTGFHRLPRLEPLNGRSFQEAHKLVSQYHPDNRNYDPSYLSSYQPMGTLHWLSDDDECKVETPAEEQLRRTRNTEAHQVFLQKEELKQEEEYHLSTWTKLVPTVSSRYTQSEKQQRWDTAVRYFPSSYPAHRYLSYLDELTIEPESGKFCVLRYHILGQYFNRNNQEVAITAALSSLAIRPSLVLDTEGCGLGRNNTRLALVQLGYMEKGVSFIYLFHVCRSSTCYDLIKQFFIQHINKLYVVFDGGFEVRMINQHFHLTFPHLWDIALYHRYLRGYKQGLSLPNVFHYEATHQGRELITDPASLLVTIEQAVGRDLKASFLYGSPNRGAYFSERLYKDLSKLMYALLDVYLLNHITDRFQPLNLNPRWSIDYHEQMYRIRTQSPKRGMRRDVKKAMASKLGGWDYDADAPYLLDIDYDDDFD